MHQHQKKFERSNQGTQIQSYRRQLSYHQSKPFFRQPFHEAYYNKRVFDNSNNGDRPNQRWIHGSIINKEKLQEPLKKRLANPALCPVQLQRHQRFGQINVESPNSVSPKSNVVVPAVKHLTKVFIDANPISFEDRIVEDEKKPRGSVSDEAYLLQAFEPTKDIRSCALSKKANALKHGKNEGRTAKSNVVVDKVSLSPSLLKSTVSSSEVESFPAVKPALQNGGTKGGFGSFRRGKPTPGAVIADSTRPSAASERANGCFVYENNFSFDHVKNRPGSNFSYASKDARLPHRKAGSSSNRNIYDEYNQRHR